MSSQEAQLMAVTPIDGRYAERVEPLTQITSEFALMRYRVTVLAGWFGLLGSGILPDREPLTVQAQDYLAQIPSNFTVANALEIKALEKITNHDVTAGIRWLEEKVGRYPLVFGKYRGLVHLMATSEDVNNLSTAMVIRDTRDDVLVPGVTRIRDDLDDKAQAWADIHMLSHTHGQPASPTTLGKEMAVFRERLTRHLQSLGQVSILGKFNSATGTLAAMYGTYPEVDWLSVTRQFVEGRLGFEFNDTTTQIEPHDYVARFLKEVSTGNTILSDLAQDVWYYTMLRYFKLKTAPGEDGSSIMPYKVNPIDFENGEANFGVGNAILLHLAQTLPVSRLQRHLSDSSALRALGEGFGHTLVGHSSLLRGLGKILANEGQIYESLSDEYEVLMELVQNVARRHGMYDAYDKIKAISKGKQIDSDGYREIVTGLGLPDDAVNKLLAVAPIDYVGVAPQIARGEV